MRRFGDHKQHPVLLDVVRIATQGIVKPFDRTRVVFRAQIEAADEELMLGEAFFRLCNFAERRPCIRAARIQLDQLLKLFDGRLGKGLVAVGRENLLVVAHAGHVDTVRNLGVARVQASEVFEIVRRFDKLVLLIMRFTEPQFGEHGIGTERKLFTQFLKRGDGFDEVARLQKIERFFVVEGVVQGGFLRRRCGGAAGKRQHEGKRRNKSLLCHAGQQTGQTVLLSKQTTACILP